MYSRWTNPQREENSMSASPSTPALTPERLKEIREEFRGLWWGNFESPWPVISELCDEVERLQGIATEAKADRDSMWKFAFRCARHLNASQLTEASQGTDVTVNICGENGPEMILASRTDRGINAR